MISTINISLPKKLKEAADALVAGGEYASFSDLARTALRQIILDRKYKLMIDEARREHALGLSTVINNKEELDTYLKQLGKWNFYLQKVLIESTVNWFIKIENTSQK